MNKQYMFVLFPDLVCELEGANRVEIYAQAGKITTLRVYPERLPLHTIVQHLGTIYDDYRRIGRLHRYLWRNAETVITIWWYDQRHYPFPDNYIWIITFGSNGRA